MSNFILTLKLKTQPYQGDILDKRFNILRQMYNACLGHLLKQYKEMINTEEYKYIVNQGKGSTRNKQLQELNNKYGLTEYSLHRYIKPMQHHFKENIDSFTAQKIATRCFNAFKKYMFHEAEKVNFKKYGELNSVEGKSNKTGIRFKDNILYWNGLEIPVIIKKNDIYAQEALKNKIKYCRIKREIIKGKYHYYLQLVLEGVPPLKINKKTGEIKGRTTNGKVGIDIGTQTIAISSDYEVKLLELAPEVVNIDKEIRRLQRYMDRSKRVNNPNKYNKDGTIKKSNKDKWHFSKRYMKGKYNRLELYRKQREIRKQNHCKLANYLITLGDEFYVEDMNFKGLQKRAKETTVNEKTGKYNSKKRFGKSLANKAPSMFLAILSNKLKYQNNQLIKVNTKELKASQFNHLNCEYNKKKLSQRWNDLNGIKVQRDLYSAFLIQHVNDDLKTINIELCNKNFNRFLEFHNKEVERLISCELKPPLKNVI
ncbi:hypothetical protein SAMN02745227_01240 [Anaerobranca californiensis DSM 14826]|uniref:Transposase n=1 Tax=Anaerobranca californiensis DSM 14826 TaxID=1120989 RepID=A0A1M6NTS0_9FIRM|nr:transposase [Anaerobranca californiensis]SHJ99123.1 hypothetical protein SAMN02745227_01240 [Anaerobranca californiensis DSM 14826]